MSQEPQARNAKLSTLVASPLVVGSILVTMLGIFGPKRVSKLERARETMTSIGSDPRVTKALESTQLTLDDLAQRTGALVQATRSDLAPRTREATELAKDVVDRLRVEGASLTSDLSDRIKTEIAPAARTWAEEAVAEAEQILAIARERASDLSETTRDEYVPRVRSSAGTASELAAGTAVTAVQALGKLLADAGDKAATADAKRTVQQSKKSAGSAMQRAGNQTKYVIGETSMIVFWLAALGATIYYGVLSAEKRERVRTFFASVSGQAQDLLSEYRSNEEMPRNLDV